jgi:peptide/nickel transport system permease protein
MARKQTNMIKYIIKRVIMMVPMLIAVLIFSFILSHMMAADPMMNRLNMQMEPADFQNELRRIGYYDPIHIKLLLYFRNFFSGDWGESYVVMQGTPVLTMIARIWPKTIELMIIPIIITPIIAVRLGVTSAKNKNKNKDLIIRFAAILGAGFPVFFIAKVFQMFFFNINLNTFGEFNMPLLYSNSIEYLGYSPGMDGPFQTGFRIFDSIIYNDQGFLWDTLIHLILPIICMCITALAPITRQTRSSMLDVMDQDYIRTARAKGVEENTVLNKHALRNALIPTSNLIIGGTAEALLGSLFIETLFNYTGMGYYTVQAVFQGDYFVIQGVLVFSTIIILIGTLVTDVMYTIIDPRITYK